MRNVRLVICLVVVCVMSVANFASAELVKGIDIDFVTIGNAGNAGDTQVMTGGTSDGTTGYGAVGYNYRIGKYEITNAQWNTFTAAAGVPTGNPPDAYNQSASFTGAQQPTNMVSWYEAAQFCNYLTSGNKSLGAYQLGLDGSITVDRIAAQTASYSNGTVYVIPTEDEWYKAAYYKPNGNGYSLYANGLNTIPAADNGWNYYGGAYNTPWNVGSGGIAEQNGTYDMMGNIFEWNETLLGSSYRGLRGGSYASLSDGLDYMSSSYRWRGDYPYGVSDGIGFRVAAIPEPTTLLLLSLGGLVLRRKK